MPSLTRRDYDPTDLDPATSSRAEFPRCPLCDHRWHGLPCERSHDINGGPCPCPTAWKEPA